MCTQPHHISFNLSSCVDSFVRLLTRPFVDSFVRSFLSFVRSFVPSFLPFVRLFVPFVRLFVPFVRLFVCSFVRSFVPLFLCSFVPSFLRSFVRPSVRSSVHSWLSFVGFVCHLSVHSIRGRGSLTLLVRQLPLFIDFARSVTVRCP